MLPAVGTRKRFLFRLLLYALTPVIGLVLVISPPKSVEAVQPGGEWLGWITLSVGLVALYLLFSRMRRPWSAIGFSLQPQKTLRRMLGEAYANSQGSTSPVELRDSFLNHFSKQLPDVRLEEIETDAENLAALTVGGELQLIFSAAIKTAGDTEALVACLDGLAVPLINEKILVIIPGSLAQDVRGVLAASVPDARLIELG